MRVMFVGDINLGEYYPSFGHGPGTFAKSNDIFAKVKSIFAHADFVVGNLEAPITTRVVHSAAHESDVLKVDPANAIQLGQAGFRLLQVANNHTVQHSAAGFDDTLENLKQQNIHAIGKNEQGPLILGSPEGRLGFLAASDVPDNTDKQQDRYQKMDARFFDRIETAVNECDHLVVMLHWGLESSTGPLPYQREVVDKLYALGVRAIIGSHPHLFYEIEKRQNFVAAYSLGNFVFDLCWDPRLLKSGILDLEFKRDDLQVKFWPVQIESNGSRPAPNGRSSEVIDTFKPYDLGSSMSFQQLRKVFYFIKNLNKGHTRLKIKFIEHKLRSLF